MSALIKQSNMSTSNPYQSPFDPMESPNKYIHSIPLKSHSIIIFGFKMSTTTPTHGTTKRLQGRLAVHQPHHCLGAFGEGCVHQWRATQLIQGVHGEDLAERQIPGLPWAPGCFHR